MTEVRSILAMNEADRYRLLVDAIADYAIFMLDAEGYVASWNPGAERFKGYKADEILGQHFSRFYTEEDRAANMPERALHTAETEGRFEYEGWRVRKDGSRFWAHVIIDVIRDEEGHTIGFAKVTRDLTERREAALSLAQTKEELLQSQKMEAIGRLTGGVAHDFNNLLMAITGSLELLRKRIPDDQRLIRLIDNAMQGARRGASLTQRMLAFARRQELRPDLVDVAGLVSSMTELLARSLGPTIEIETYTVGPLSRVLIDANQLELAILNLAVNAKDAMSEGGRLVITAENQVLQSRRAGLDPGRYVTLSLTDTGTGMDDETLAHATEPFFTTKGVGKGTGLGLAMVRGLTEQSGGTVIIESTLGVGTTVTLWLPEATAEAVDAPAAEPAEPTIPAEPEPDRPLRVLVVDDDFLVAMNTSAMLEDLGHEVVEVHSGQLALEQLRNNNGFDLMITDQAMPQMTGIQLIDAAQELNPHLRVVLATGYAELPPGADQSIPRLSKPFFQSDLEKLLAQIVPRAD
ncbi:MAG: PAS domain S-box protein [Devosia sp.]|jgi:PAS domain S-box-containing protein|nr:PAS domain S-box protein [Devosia sp.]